MFTLVKHNKTVEIGGHRGRELRRRPRHVRRRSATTCPALLGVGVRRGVEDGDLTGQLTLEKLVLQLHVALL